MAKDNIAYHSIRLNLHNEQHLRIHRILTDLNPDIHKSINQFMVNAVDFYVSSFEEGFVVKAETEQKPEGGGFITREDLEFMQKEMLGVLKEEMIRILGSALVSSRFDQPTDRRRERKEERQEEDMVDDAMVVGLADKWG